MKTWLLASSTSTSLGAVPTATVHSRTPIAHSRTPIAHSRTPVSWSRMPLTSRCKRVTLLLALWIVSARIKLATELDRCGLWHHPAMQTTATSRPSSLTWSGMVLGSPASYRRSQESNRYLVS
jgi:hypothetical protein